MDAVSLPVPPDALNAPATTSITVVPKRATFQRLHYLHARYGRWRQRAQQVDAVASLPGALLITLTPTITDDAASDSARLSIVPAPFSRAIRVFTRHIRRAGATYALRLCSRASGGLWWPHAHGVVVGLSPARLERFARRSGLTIHVETIHNPEAVGKYVLSSKQAKPYDRAPSRTFWSNAVSLPKRARA